MNDFAQFLEKLDEFEKAKIEYNKKVIELGKSLPLEPDNYRVTFFNKKGDKRCIIGFDPKYQDFPNIGIRIDSKKDESKDPWYSGSQTTIPLEMIPNLIEELKKFC